jgi:SAM-dependent methyltransferase
MRSTMEHLPARVSLKMSVVVFVASRLVAALSLFAAPVHAAQDVRFLRFDEVAETLGLFRDSGVAGAEIASSSAWDAWVRARDAEVRGRIDRGVEDSISNLILFGTSFTKLPRLDSADSVVVPGAGAAIGLTHAAQARIHALAVALASSSRAERIVFVRDFLKSKGITAGLTEGYLSRNLQRLALEQRAYQEKLKEAGETGDKSAILLARGTLYQQRGLSIDTSLLPNFALQDTLRVMLQKNAIKPGTMRRILIIGPGLDFTDKRDGFDFYPRQTIQPFAMLEALVKLGLGNAEEISVVTADLNPAVNAHVTALAERGRKGKSYTVQLPRQISAEWSEEAVDYWTHFGESLGTPAKPLPIPVSLQDVTMRAVTIRPEFAARFTGYDLNAVTQTLDLPEGQKFDLVVATNVLVYYDLFQQALAMSSIAHMMNPGGIFLVNHALPALHPKDLEYIGGRSVKYTPSGAYGDDVAVYRKR